MKISMQENNLVTDVEITITYNRMTPEIDKIISTLKMLDKQLPAFKENETFFLDISQLLYIESVDKKTFIYTERDVYETALKLYELQGQLEEAGFVRASKSCIINLKHIKSLKADIDRRIRVTMENGEQLIVSRQYAEQLKKRLGVK